MSKRSCVSRTSLRLLPFPPWAQTVDAFTSRLFHVTAEKVRPPVDPADEGASVEPRARHKCDTPARSCGALAGRRNRNESPRVDSTGWNSETVDAPRQRLCATIGCPARNTRDSPRRARIGRRARASAFPTRKARESHRKFAERNARATVPQDRGSHNKTSSYPQG
jgi:hypothetical protein